MVPKNRRICDGVLVVCDAEGRGIALLVDELNGKQEVVIKGLGRMFERVAGVAGGAILGDGKIGLILDIKGLLEGETMREALDFRPTTLKPSEFRTIRDLLYDRAGIDLQPGKETLVACRLSKSIREGKFRSFGDYMRTLGKTHRILSAGID